MGARHPVVLELVADCIPGRTTVVGSLDHLSEPARRLRRIDPVWIDRRGLEVKNLPAGEEWSFNRPVGPCAVGSQNKCPFAGADENSDPAHGLSPSNDEVT